MSVQMCDLTLHGELSYYISCTVASEVYCCNNFLYKVLDRISMSSMLIPFITDLQQITLACSENVKRRL